MDNGNKLVGLTGRKGSGKDTAAKALLEQGYQNVKFAGALKDMLRCLLGYQGVDAELIERMVEGDLKEEPTAYLQGKSPRHAMQTLGTEWGRDLIGEDLWVHAAMNRASLANTVITDVRFPNECEAVKNNGGIVVRVTNGGNGDSSDDHPSEVLIDQLPVDRELLNVKESDPSVTEWSIRRLGEKFLAMLDELRSEKQQ